MNQQNVKNGKNPERAPDGKNPAPHPENKAGPSVTTDDEKKNPERSRIAALQALQAQTIKKNPENEDPGSHEPRNGKFFEDRDALQAPRRSIVMIKEAQKLPGPPQVQVHVTTVTKTPAKNLENRKLKIF